MGCSNHILNEVLENDVINNTLIVSKPGIGKTTILRDLARNISDSGKKVGIIDERCEITATYKGVPQNNIGIRTDVLYDVPKPIGMKMMIRTMAPEVIIADEIGNKEDVEAIKFAACCGVSGIFSAHGKTPEDIEKNPVLNSLLKEKIIEKVIFLEKKNGIRNYKTFNY